jgi:putative CocE/NonD family hydrolase
VLNEWPVDLTPLIDRPDVLVYVSDPMTKPVTIAGSVTVVAYASSDARDTDFVALIEDVGPDGYGIKLGSKPAGVVRARHRNGLDREELLTPGKPEQFNIYCGHFGHTFMPGHRIRISIASSLYPRFSINPNTGNPIATDTDEPRKARQRIFHDAARPSHVLLPVMPEN